jgi:hypothetical protein
VAIPEDPIRFPSRSYAHSLSSGSVVLQMLVENANGPGIAAMEGEDVFSLSTKRLWQVHFRFSRIL